MSRRLVYVLAVLAFAAGVARAERLRVRFKKVDAEARTVTVEIYNPEIKQYVARKEYPVSANVKVYQGGTLGARDYEKGLKEAKAYPGGFKAFAARVPVDRHAVLTLEGGVVSSINVGPVPLHEKEERKAGGDERPSTTTVPRGGGHLPSPPQEAARYALVGAGKTAVLLDTATGRSWVLKSLPDGGAVWLPCRRLDSEADVERWRHGPEAAGQGEPKRP
jgi:hypothetical protein